jgi:hypothetical protein
MAGPLSGGVHSGYDALAWLLPMVMGIMQDHTWGPVCTGDRSDGQIPSVDASRCHPGGERSRRHEQETLATMVHLLTSGQVRLSDKAISGIKALFVTTNVAA